MKTETFPFNNGALHGMMWIPDDEPKALLQITHGMTEHIGRYAVLGEYLAGHGILTAGFDLRGHGRNPGDVSCASFGEGGWDASLEDMHLFYGYLAERFPGLPHFMLGFSLGSFLLREYPCRYDDPIAGAAILGTGHQPAAILGIMMGVVKSQMKKAGFDGTTPLVKKLSFDTYNSKFKPARTDFDWLCADVEQLDGYISDPLCRSGISAGLFHQLLGSMKRTGWASAYDGWDKSMPVLLLSGEDDPVGDSGKGVIRVKNAMEAGGLVNLTMHLLPGARHDVLHEEVSGCAAQAREMLAIWMTGIISDII